MLDLFLYDNVTCNLKINEYEILLIKEFAALWDIERNKCKEDPKGTKRLRAWREFKYIWLFCDWKSDVLVDGKSYRTFVLEHYGKSKLTAKLVDKFREDVANGKIKL